MNITEKMNVIHEYMCKYRAEIADVMKRYRAEKAHIIKTYREDVAAEKLASARASAQHSIYAADRMLCESVKLEMDEARTRLNDAVMPNEKNDAVCTIRMYREFNILPTETELRTIAKKAGGNVFALRALSEWAKEHNYRVSAPSVEQYMQEFKRMEQFFDRPPFLYAPFEYAPEAAEILPDKVMYRDDGSEYMSGGRPDTAEILAHTQYFETVAKNVAHAESEWGFTFIPEIQKIDPAKYNTRQEAEDAQQAELERFESAVNAQVNALQIDQPAPDPAPGMNREQQATVVAHYE